MTSYSATRMFQPALKTASKTSAWHSNGLWKKKKQKKCLMCPYCVCIMSNQECFLVCLSQSHNYRYNIILSSVDGEQGIRGPAPAWVIAKTSATFRQSHSTDAKFFLSRSRCHPPACSPWQLEHGSASRLLATEMKMREDGWRICPWQPASEDIFSSLLINR